MNDLTEYLSNPLIIAIVAAVGVLLLLLLVWALLRGRKGGQKGEDQIRTELAAMERETQFSGVAAQVRFQESPEAVAADVAAACREYLGLPVFKIYAGHDSDTDFANILPKLDGAVVTNDLTQSAALPPAMPAPLARGFTRPQAVNINALIGAAATGTGQGVTVIPWRGAFGWSGLMVAGAMNSNPADALAVYHEPLALLGDKLAVALEMASGRAGNQMPLLSPDNRAANTENFYQTIMRALDWQASLQDIIEASARLASADSASLWLYDSNTRMLSVEVSHGLKTSEFLPLPEGQGLAGSVFASATPLALADAPSDPRCIFPREARESGVGSYLGVPVKVDDVLVGVLEVHTPEPRYWTDPEVSTLEAAAAALSTVLKNQVPGSSNLKVESAYFGLSEALQRLRTPDELLEAIVEVFGNALGVSRVVALALDSSGGSATVRHEFRLPDVKSAVGASFSESQIRELTAALPGNAAVAAGEVGRRSFLGDEMSSRLDVVSELAAPLREKETTRAVIFLQQCDRVRAWNPDEREFVNRVCRHLALSLDHIASQPSAGQAATPMGGDVRAATDGSRAVLDSLPEAVIGLDGGGRLTFFNQAAHAWLGLRQEDLGKAAGSIDALQMTDGTIWSRVVGSQAVARFESKLKRAVAAAPGLSPSPLYAADAAETVSLSVAPVRASAGNEGGFVVVLSDIDHVPSMAADVMARITRLKEQQAELERNIAEARAAELQTRARIEKLNTLESGMKDGGQVARRYEEELSMERERFRNERAQLQSSLQQMLDTNKLKSEFIVNCGSEIEASLQSTVGVAQLLDQGAYGALSPQQREAVREILNLGSRIRSDIASLIEYGASRVR